jgi:hypothetical protein
MSRLIVSPVFPVRRERETVPEKRTIGIRKKERRKTRKNGISPEGKDRNPSKTLIYIHHSSPL